MSQRVATFDSPGLIIRDDVGGMASNRHFRFVRYADGGIAAFYPTNDVATWLPGPDVVRVDIDEQTTYVKRTPTWATILGVIGLFFFLIGIVFFFVKTTEPVLSTVVTVHALDGRVLAFRVPHAAGEVRPRFA
jgi:hypothetical protein